MGTFISLLPSFDFVNNESSDLETYFKDGLVGAINSQDTITPVRIGATGQRSLSGILRNSSALASRSARQSKDTGNKKKNLNESAKGQVSSRSSRLPTPVKTNKRATNLTETEISPNADYIRSEVTSLAQLGIDSVNANTDKTYRPEAWPTADYIQEHLNKRGSSPTTIILARFAPRNSRDFIEIGYSTNKSTDEKVFDCSGRLDNLISCREGYELGSTTDLQIEYFFRIFKACINSLQGQVWWNGFSLIFDQTSTKNRLKVSAFELDPSQLLFELVNMKDLEIHRSSTKVELRGQPENGAEESCKSFCVRGQYAKDVKISKLRGNLITLHVPEYVSCGQF